jgi:hypothetical protein
MMTQTTLSAPVRETLQKETVRDEIVALMQELPDDSLLMLREFGRFLRFQVQQRRTVLVPVPANMTHVPTFQSGQTHFSLVRVSPAQLLHLIGAFPPLGGDALADTEALYEKD